jgi:hypothetical protein
LKLKYRTSFYSLFFENFFYEICFIRIKNQASERLIQTWKLTVFKNTMNMLLINNFKRLIMSVSNNLFKNHSACVRFASFLQNNIYICLKQDMHLRWRWIYSFDLPFSLRRLWRYQKGNQNLQIEEQTTPWPKEKGQKNKQRSRKHYTKIKDRVTRIPLKIGVELMCSGRISSSHPLVE